MSNEIKFDICPICGMKKDAVICKQCGWEFKIYANPLPEALQAIETQRLNIAKTIWQKCLTANVPVIDESKIKTLEEKLEKANEKIKNQTDHLKIIEEKKTETESKLKEANARIAEIELKLKDKPVVTIKKPVAFLIAEGNSEECIYGLYSGLNAFCPAGRNDVAFEHQEIPVWSSAKARIEINIDTVKESITLKEISTGQTFNLDHGSKFKIGNVSFRISIAV